MSGVVEELLSQQARGLPIEVILVLENSEGDPRVCAFFAEASPRLVIVDYDVEGGIVLNTEGHAAIEFDRKTLAKIADLEIHARRKRKELNRYFKEDKARWVGLESFLAKKLNDCRDPTNDGNK